MARYNRLATHGQLLLLGTAGQGESLHLQPPPSLVLEDISRHSLQTAKLSLLWR